MFHIKSKNQIKQISKACKVASKSLNYISRFIQAGITTLELNNELDSYIRKAGCSLAVLGYKGFPASCCISINDEVCHGIPSERKLIDGDIVKIDVVVEYEYYFGDTCQTFLVRGAGEKSITLYSVAHIAMWTGIEVCRSGTPINEIGKAIEEYVDEEKLFVVPHYTGHGVGIKIHEEPLIRHTVNSDDRELRENMVITIEPMINEISGRTIKQADNWTEKTADGGNSAQFEHTILIQKNGFEVLTI